MAAEHIHPTELMTVGRLAKRLGLRPSALRYYEELGLLPPTAHSEGGYRLYDAAAEERLRFILRCQRLGFSLADIAALIEARDEGAAGDAALARIAEARYVALERQLTPLLVARHELAHLLQDLSGGGRGAKSRLARLLDEVCAEPSRQPAETTLDRLLALTGCRLSSTAARAALATLRGAHAHLWQEGEAYHILVVGDDPALAAALEQLTSVEAGCAAHGPTIDLELRPVEGGRLLVARGEDAFLYARLFMGLEGG